MSEIEAVKLISNTKFEEVAAMPTPLGPSTVQVWSRDFGDFLVLNSAVALVVHNNEMEQKGTWFGEVLASRSSTSELGGRQAVELGVAETNERPRIALQNPYDRTSARLVNICKQKIHKLDTVVVKIIMDSLSNVPSAQFPGGFRNAVQERLESEQLEHFDDPDLSDKHKTSHHVLRTAMQMLAAFATYARIALEDKLRNESIQSEDPAEITAFAQRARKLCMGLVAMGVHPTTVSGLLQQSIMRQPLQSVPGFELRRDVAQKGAAFALPELLSRVTELASTMTLMGAMAGKGLGQSPLGSDAMALQVGLQQKTGRRIHDSEDKKEKFCYNFLDDGACRKAECKFSHVPRCPKDRDGRCDDRLCKLAHDFRQARRKDRVGPTTPPRAGRAERSPSQRGPTTPPHTGRAERPSLQRSCFNCGGEGHVQRNCPRPKKEREPVQTLATAADADANHQYIFSSRGRDGTQEAQIYLDTSASAHFVGSSSLLELPVRGDAIIHDSLGGTQAGSAGTFTFRAGGEISLQDVVAARRSEDHGVSWRALTQSFDVAMVLDVNGGMVINNDGTQLMDLSYDIDGLVVVREISSDGLRSARRSDSGRPGDSHVSILINKIEDRPDLLSSTNSDNDLYSPPPSPPPRERDVPEDGPPPLDLASATAASGEEQNAFVLRAGMPTPRGDDRWCAFDTAAAMPMTSDRERISPGTRHQVDVDIIPYGAEATRVREAGTMLVRSRGKDLLFTNTLLTERGPTIVAWSVLAKKGCTCLLGGAGGALYDSKGVLFATMRFHERAKILIIDEGEAEPICPFPASVDPRMVRCEVFTVLSGSGIFQGGDLLADRALSRRVGAAVFAAPGAAKAAPTQGTRRKVSFVDTQSGSGEGRPGSGDGETKEEVPQLPAAVGGREERALRLSKEAMNLAHLRLGHASQQRIVQLAKSGAVRGFSMQEISREPAGDDTCESCLAGNWRKGPLNPGGPSGRETLLRGPSTAKLPEAGRLMGCDLYGPLNFETIDGTRYIMALFDVATGFWMMNRLHDASARATAAALRAAHTDLRTHLVEVRALRLDHGSHWRGEFTRTCTDLRVAMQYTSGPRNQQQNGGVESNFGIQASIARKSLHQANLPPKFFVESMDHAGQFTRRSLPPGGGAATRMELMIGVKPHFRELHPFGCEVKVRSEPTSKAVPDRSISALFMGVSSGGVRVFNIATGKMLTCRFGDCRIRDRVFPCNPSPGEELKLKYRAYRRGRDETDAMDLELLLVIDDEPTADGQQEDQSTSESDSAVRMIMEARGASARSGRTMRQEFDINVRLGRLDEQSCSQLWAMLPGVGGVFSPPNAPCLRDLHDGGRMLMLPGFRGALLESLRAVAGGLLISDTIAIFRGEQGAAAAIHSVTYWGAVAVRYHDNTLLQTSAAIIDRSGRGMCELTVTILDDALAVGELGKAVGIWQIAHRGDREALETWLSAQREPGPPNIREPPGAASDGGDGRSKRGSMEQRASRADKRSGAGGPGPATPPLPQGLTFTRTGEGVKAGDRILHIFSSNGERDWHEGEVVATPTTAAEKKRGHLYNVRYSASEMRAQGLRQEDYRKHWLRIEPQVSSGHFDVELGSAGKVAVLSVPVSRRVALAGSDRVKWEEAIHKEYAAMEDNGTWIAVDERSAPPGAQVLPSSLVLTKKQKKDASGSGDATFKARIVCQGNLERENGEDTFSPTAGMRFLCLFFNILALLAMTVIQFDFTQAYLNGLIEKDDIYMRPPAGTPSAGTGVLLRLIRNIYGRRPAGKNWYLVLRAFLLSLGFFEISVEPCWMCLRTELLFILIVIWVDDTLMGFHEKDRRRALEIVRRILDKFKGRMVQEDCFAGLQYNALADGSYVLHQTDNADGILERAGMERANAAKAPGVHGTVLRRHPNPQPGVDNKLYMRQQGEVRWQTIARWDMLAAAAQTGQAQNFPGKDAEAAMKHALRYLAGPSFGIRTASPIRPQPAPGTWASGITLEVSAFSDAAFLADYKEHGRSQMGALVMVNGTPVAAYSKLTSKTELSTHEAELAALDFSRVRAEEVAEILREVGLLKEGPIVLYCDNDSVCTVAGAQLLKTTKSRMIWGKYHKIREQVEAGELRVVKVATGDNLADFLTKVLRAPELARQRGRVMVDVQKTLEEVGVRPKL